MKVYLSGKITGDDEYRWKFMDAQTALELNGHVVLNPALLPTGLDEDDYMRIALAMLDSADMMVCLPDRSLSLLSRALIRSCVISIAAPQSPALIR